MSTERRPGSLPAFHAVEHPELAALQAPGIRLAGPAAASLQAPCVVVGKFVIAEDELRRRAGTPHRDLVLTILSPPLYYSCHPFRDVLFFKDDVQANDGLCFGWFSFDLWAYCPFQTEGEHFLRMSLGTALSAAVEIDVA